MDKNTKFAKESALRVLWNEIIEFFTAVWARVLLGVIALLIVALMVFGFPRLAVVSVEFKDGDRCLESIDLRASDDIRAQIEAAGFADTVYGEGAEEFFFTYKGKEYSFASSEKEVKKMIADKAMMNILLFKWSDENYVIELNTAD